VPQGFAAAGGVEGAAEGLAAGAGGAAAPGPVLRQAPGLPGGFAAGGVCACTLAITSEIAAGISATMARRTRRGQFIRVLHGRILRSRLGSRVPAKSAPRSADTILI